MIFNLANPLRFQRLIEKIEPITLNIAITLLLVGLFFCFFGSPPDYLQGETVRIMYIHVPCAWFSLMIYSIIALCSIFSIVFKHTLADLISRSCAPIGACFTLATLLSGSIWGKPTWGTWWVWDARLTSELVLLVIYLGLIIINNAYEDKSKADRYSSILAIIGLVNLPIVKFSVDWWTTLHQESSVLRIGGPSMTDDYLITLFVSFFGIFMLTIFWFSNIFYIIVEKRKMERAKLLND